MAIAWTDLPLTQAQRDKMLQFETLGAQVGPGGTPPVPSLTYTDAKRAREWFQDLYTRVKTAEAGVRYTLQHYQNQAVKDFDNANP